MEQKQTNNTAMEIVMDDIDISLIPETELTLLAQELEEEIYAIVLAKRKKHKYYENAKQKLKKPP